MIQPQTLKASIEIAKTVWAALGPLVGVFVGAWLNRSWDRQKWMKDNRKQECKELLWSISQAGTKIMLHRMTAEPGKPDKRQMSDAFFESLKVFQSSIFIAKDIESCGLFDLWTEAVHEFNTNADHKQFDSSIDKIRTKIIGMATK